MAGRLALLVLMSGPWLGPVVGQTPGEELRAACSRGDLDQVAKLLQEGAPIEEGDNLGRTPLIIAAYGKPALVQLLLQHGANPNGVSKVNNSALGDAADLDKLDNVRLLVEAGADLDHVSNFRRTPLDMAAENGFDDVVSYLLAHHARINLGDSDTDALFYAVWKDRLPTAQLLLAAGASVHVPHPAQTPHGWLTLMEQAARTGDEELVDLLLDHGASLDERDDRGHAALFAAVTAGNRGMVAHLLQKGANPNLPTQDGYTPFLSAVTYLGPDYVQLMIDYGASIDARTPGGRTPLMLAVIHSGPEKVRELLALHPDVNLRDQAGESALTYAEDRGASRAVHLLLQAGAEPRPPHIIPKAPHEALTPAQQWALAVGAIYAQRNGASQTALTPDPEDKRASIHELGDEWVVNDRASLLQRIADLDQPVAAPAIAAEEESFLADAATRGGWPAAWTAFWALVHQDIEWRGKLNVAWNTCRAANLVRSGVDAGYLKEEDAWPVLYRNAELTQSAYSSWREMSESFIDGRMMAHRKVDPDFDACAALLLNPQDPNSPWNQLAWNTNLDK